MYKCPHCGNESISLYKKANLDMRYNSKCKKCGEKYGLHSYSYLLDLMFLLGYFLILRTNFTEPIKIVLGILLFLVDTLFNILFVPIVKK
ncbi:MAG: hypothetical protein K0R15_2645 [Clostridiales bacterium]|jgi:uncharacterized protein (DUF983 family)|nr:hypothetical protein [Clostridiales bacterium]